MDGFSIKIEGLAELKSTFEALAKTDADRAVLRALQAGAKIEQAAIAEAAPVNIGDGGILPKGALKTDIEIHTRRDSSGIPYVTVSPGKYTRWVANLVEYGHRLVRGGRSSLLANGKTRGPGQEIGTVAAHPFIRVGYESSREGVAAAISTTLVTEIEKAAAKRGK